MSGAAPSGPALADTFGRRFRYLRLSVTEVCNFRCTYCLPDGYRKQGTADFLSVEEVGRLVGAFARLGIGKVRLTGGEPTVRRDIEALIARVAATPGIGKVALTTNGWNLRRHVAAWRGAGLTHLNVSVDDLDRTRFAAVTGGDRLPAVLAGIDAALEAGMPAVKLNAVLLADQAEPAFQRFAAFVRDRPIAARFIELMRTADNAAYFAANHLPGDRLRGWLDAQGWAPLPRTSDGGPATEYAHPDHRGRIGLIAPYAPGFCDSCNRLRVTARGRLRLCLFGSGGVDLRSFLAQGQEAALANRIRSALTGKAAGHRLHRGDTGDLRQLAQLGG
ncbi:GTP 3',8-cyclase MoaA [Sphingomonas parapaucimobilis]|uniref:GTP 3',8-cyclase n=1 Tax=Sphingomonas parapaucimobilis NBRC 15100 TaxID=1219049 RepID=A0A0A1W9L4_9SPHN|nr:GTP 3',8-cyclase MoaA [Sphingomonas parapaucimobilis]GAM01837.1 molybdenum cofactor biosynthesis protein A [Sphingomonas parapaucimobilis NBRC 15100]